MWPVKYQPWCQVRFPTSPYNLLPLHLLPAWNADTAPGCPTAALWAWEQSHTKRQRRNTEGALVLDHPGLPTPRHDSWETNRLLPHLSFTSVSITSCISWGSPEKLTNKIDRDRGLKSFFGKELTPMIMEAEDVRSEIGKLETQRSQCKSIPSLKAWETGELKV